MKYISTRGNSPTLSFKQALLVGLAHDGGLYVPEAWPQLTPDQISSFRHKPYTEVAIEIMSLFIGDEIPEIALRNMIKEAYASFHHDAVAPLIQTNHNEWVLELFHGPTLAFKDVAMQILARLIDYVLAERNERLTIVGATSGDTGGAALTAFSERENIDVFFMFPEGRVSPVQQRQMTTLKSKNTYAIAVKGNFDDCQGIVKNMFGNARFRDAVKLSAVNSINWGRIMAQTIYYFTAASRLGAPERKLSFTVPTGNFGDIYAGYVAKKMGLTIDRLVIATSENDILDRVIKSACYEVRDVFETITPSMDIQISSNFERLLFDSCDQDYKQVVRLMMSLETTGSYRLSSQQLKMIRYYFDSGHASQSDTKLMMNNILTKSNYLLDPHTAVACAVARRHNQEKIPMVVLGTAHPAKFPKVVEEATGIKPQLPKWAIDSITGEESFVTIEGCQTDIENFIMSNSRVPIE